MSTSPHPSASSAPLLRISRVLIKLWLVLNGLTGLLVVVMLLASFFFEPTFQQFFSTRPPRIDPGLLIPTLRLAMLLALPMFAFIHVLLSRLLSIIETVRVGDPFVPENAVRLTSIAWCLLAVQLLHLVFGAMTALVNAAGSNVVWKHSGTGWVAVVLLFVLARVFQEGTRMRTDLQEVI